MPTLSQKITAQEKYDNFKFFHELNDTKLAEKYKISRSRIAQLRKQYVPETNTFELRKKLSKEHYDKNFNQKISNYLKNNSENICLRDCRKELKLASLTRRDLQNKASELNIKISFNSSEFDHGVGTHIHKHCRCKICKLAIAIKKHFQIRKIKIKAKEIDVYANLLVDEYHADKTRYKLNFYSDIKNRHATRIDQ